MKPRKKRRPLTDTRKARVKAKVEKARSLENGERKEILDIEPDEATYLLQLALEAYRESHQVEITDDIKKTSEMCRSTHPKKLHSHPDEKVDL